MKRRKIRVPIPKPFTRVPIKPAVRHVDRRRKRKHKGREDHRDHA